MVSSQWSNTKSWGSGVPEANVGESLGRIPYGTLYHHDSTRIGEIFCPHFWALFEGENASPVYTYSLWLIGLLGGGCYHKITFE